MDVVADMLHLPFKDESFETLQLMDCLEHVGRLQVYDALKEYRRVLCCGGEMKIKTPNLETLARMYLGGELPMVEIARRIFGQQDYESNLHRCIFDPPTLSDLLRQSGFKITHLAERLDYPTNMMIRARRL